MAQKEKIKKQVRKEEFLEYLRNLISQVEQGYVLIGDKKIELPESFELKIKCEEEDKKKEVEWKIEWKI